MILDQQQLIRNLLFEYFLRAQEGNPRFSMRALAKKAGVSSAELSELLRGKRKVSQEKALEYAKRLRFSREKVERIKKAFSPQGRLESLKTTVNPLHEVVITGDRQSLMADWVCFALVALMRTEDFRADPEWMSKRLCVQPAVVEGALERLIEAGIVSRTSSGGLKEVSACFRTSEGFPDELQRKRQIDGLRNAIARIEAGDRLQIGSFSTISADLTKLPEAEKLIEDFLKRLSLFLADGKKTEVLELQIQLFPLSHPVRDSAAP